MNGSTSDEFCGFSEAYADEQLRRSRHPLRRFIKGFYLRSVLPHVEGPTIDFGCGAGQLLERLPAGSTGLELNPFLIRQLSAQGLDARPSTADEVAFDLRSLQPGCYRTLVISHVLEHLPDPTAMFGRLLRACRRLGVRRVIVIVPGAKGYASDATHRCFIDWAYAASHGWRQLEGFQLTARRFFPWPRERGGDWFVYNEMQLMFDDALANGACG